MDWSKVKRTPQYNPFIFEVARHSLGWTKSDLSKKSNLPVRIITQIEKGDIAPTKEQAETLISQYADHYLPSFFEQWWETKLNFSGPFAKSIPIDYYQYKVFRDCNPPRLSAV